MKALMCNAFGLPNTLRYEDAPDPLPGPGQVLLDMQAAGVNFPDALIIQGKYQFKPALPFAPGAEPAFRSIAWNGRYLVIGFADGQIPSLPLNLPLLKGASVVGVFWGEYVTRQLFDFIRDLGEMFALIESGKLRPHVSKTYPLAQGAQALQDLLDRKVIGKVVITRE
ncbi:MAG TPA: zinc-binding dehydrogenase [Limnobacter sp.]|nr:zinc-binding dehydrogenase [Limnobacter sp.]